MFSTPPSLLERVRQPSDHAAWGKFVHIYSPLLYSWGRKLGRAEHESADFVQEVLIHLVKKMPEFVYDPDRRFRAWLWTIALNKHRELDRRKAAPRSIVDVEPWIEDGTPDWVEKEYQAFVLRRAVELVRQDFEESTWQMFWAVTIEGREPKAVAESMGVRTGVVYVAKSRVLRTLKQELRGLLDDFS